MKNTTWQLVESGQIVSFRYKSENRRSVNRTVLCLDPEFRYRKKSTNRVVQFFIGLELNASDKPSFSQLQEQNNCLKYWEQLTIHQLKQLHKKWKRYTNQLKGFLKEIQYLKLIFEKV